MRMPLYAMRLCNQHLPSSFDPSLFIMSFTPMTPTIALMAELPETLHEALTQYVEKHPDWDQDRAIAAALSLFLRQGPSESAGSRYLGNYGGSHDGSCEATIAA